MLSGSSNALVVELINNESVTIAQEKIYLKNGVGKGDFKLDPTLQSGPYLLRAYTTLISYFGDNLLFEKKIQISKPTGATTISETARGNSAVVSSAWEEIITASQKIAVKFFPESGSMVENVPGMVAFTTKKGGKGMAASGQVFDSSGQLILNLESDNSGQGVFILKPLSNMTYYVRGKFQSGESFHVVLPPALQKGIVLHAENKDSVLAITLKTNDTFLNENLNRSFSISLRSKGRISHTSKIVLRQAELLIQIKKSNLPAGITEIRLADSTSRPHCERLVYIETAQKPRVSVSTNKVRYNPKEKATVSIKVVDEDSKPVLANLSIAVIDAEAAGENQTNILSYLQLKSELKGEIENVNQYFDESNPQRDKKLDFLLLTQGWRDFIWRRLLDKETRVKKESYLDENRHKDQIVLRGQPERVIPLVSKDSTILKEVVIKGRQSVRLLDQSFVPFAPGEVFFVEPKDYDHKNLRHFLLHYSPSVLTDNELNVYFTGRRGKVLYPRLVVDGVSLPFTDDATRNSYYEKYLNMPIDAFEKIEIKRGIDRSESALTTSDPYGVIEIQDIVVMFLTSNSAVSRNTLNALKELENTFYTGRDFYTPDYENLNVHSDIRTTIHWEPNVITSDAGEVQLSFFNSTLPHKIKVLVEGVTENMGPISGSTIFEVKAR